MSAGVARVGRDGALSLAFRRRGTATILAASRSILPLQVLAPLALADAASVVSILNPTGGVVGGDRFAIDVDVGPGADACLTTPSANRIYRAAAEPAEQAVRLRLGPGASLEWVPDHGIPFPGAAFRQTIDAEVGEGATLVLMDAWAAGRVARNEAWRFALLDSALTARDGAGLLVHDRFVLPAAVSPTVLGLAEGRPYFATVVVIADEGVGPFGEALEDAAPAWTGAVTGLATLPRRGALVRCLADSAPALATALDGIWTLARREVLKKPPLALRKC